MSTFTFCERKITNRSNAKYHRNSISGVANKSTGRLPSASWSITPDFALIDKITEKNIFQSTFQKVHTNFIHQLVGHVHSLVPLTMADHRLAWQMPRKCCNMFSYYCLTIRI